MRSACGIRALAQLRRGSKRDLSRSRLGVDGAYESRQGIGLPPTGSVAAAAWALSCKGGKRPKSGGRASAWITTREVMGSRLRLTRAYGGDARVTAARTSASRSPRAAARAPARAASTHATWVAAAL